MKEKKYYFVYQTTNLVNGKIYIGVHKTNNINDGYLGSGHMLTNAINKYGKPNFSRQILKFCKTEEEMYQEEAKLVNEEFIARNDTYNITLGGKSFLKNRTLGVDKSGKCKIYKTNDPRFASGEIVHPAKNMIPAMDEYGQIFRVKKDDPRLQTKELEAIGIGWCSYKCPETGERVYARSDDPRVLNGELIGASTGLTTARDKDGKYYKVPVDDPRFETGEFIHGNANRAVFIDEDGNKIWTDIDDPRRLSGKLKARTKGKILVFNKNDPEEKTFWIPRDEFSSDEHIAYHNMLKDHVIVRDSSAGKNIVVSKTDPRYKSGELVHIAKGRAPYKNVKTGEHLYLYTNDPRIKSGEFISVFKDHINVRFKNDPSKKAFIRCEDYDPKIHMFAMDKTGQIRVKDSEGNEFFTSTDDPRYKSGELKCWNDKMAVGVDKDGNSFSVPANDPRFKTGELKGVNAGKRLCRDKDGNHFMIDKSDPRFATGELIPISKGTIKVSKPPIKKAKQIFPEELEKYQQEGWIRGLWWSKSKMCTID